MVMLGARWPWLSRLKTLLVDPILVGLGEFTQFGLPILVGLVDVRWYDLEFDPWPYLGLSARCPFSTPFLVGRVPLLK